MSNKRYISGVQIWPPPRFPMIAAAKRVFLLEQKEGLVKWINALSYTQKEKLMIEVINWIAENEGRSPVEVAVEMLRGRGDVL